MNSKQRLKNEATPENNSIKITAVSADLISYLPHSFPMHPFSIP